MEYDLTILRRATDEACEMASTEPHRPAGAINWADLSCTRAERYQDDSGEIGYRVLIEEADPSATELHAYIAGRLVEMGCPGVEVVTEW